MATMLANSLSFGRFSATEYHFLYKILQLLLLTTFSFIHSMLRRELFLNEANTIFLDYRRIYNSGHSEHLRLIFTYFVISIVNICCSSLYNFSLLFF